MEGPMHSPKQSRHLTALAIDLKKGKCPIKQWQAQHVCTRICFCVTGSISYHARIMETRSKLRYSTRWYTNEQFIWLQKWFFFAYFRTLGPERANLLLQLLICSSDSHQSRWTVSVDPFSPSKSTRPSPLRSTSRMISSISRWPTCCPRSFFMASRSSLVLISPSPLVSNCKYMKNTSRGNTVSGNRSCFELVFCIVLLLSCLLHSFHVPPFSTLGVWDPVCLFSSENPRKCCACTSFSLSCLKSFLILGMFSAPPLFHAWLGSF